MFWKDCTKWINGCKEVEFGNVSKKFWPFSSQIVNWGSIGILPIKGIFNSLLNKNPPSEENMFVHS